MTYNNYLIYCSGLGTFTYMVRNYPKYITFILFFTYPLEYLQRIGMDGLTKFGRDIHGFQTVQSNNYVDLLTFDLVTLD